MKLFRLLPLALALFIAACSDKNEEPNVEPEMETAQASKTALTTFHKTDAYYQLYVYRYDDATGKWTNRIASHFSTIATTDSTFLGFTNPYVLESGVNLFGMVTMYADTLGSSNIKEARINADKVLQFFPSDTMPKKGAVKILAQDIEMRRKAGEPASIKIGISGEGTYDETTKQIDLTVIFNETAIGGKSAVARKYKLSVEPQTLN